MTLQLVLEDYRQNPKARGKTSPPQRGCQVEEGMPHLHWEAVSSHWDGKIQNQVSAPEHPPDTGFREGVEQELGGF